MSALTSVVTRPRYAADPAGAKPGFARRARPRPTSETAATFRLFGQPRRDRAARSGGTHSGLSASSWIASREIDSGVPSAAEGEHGDRSLRTRADGREHGHAPRARRASRDRREPQSRAGPGGDEARRPPVKLGRGHGQEDE